MHQAVPLQQGLEHGAIVQTDAFRRGKPQASVIVLDHVIPAADESTIAATLQNTLTYPISDAFSSHIELDGSYEPSDEDPDFDLSLKGYLDIAVTESWQASLAGTYLAGLKSGGGFYHSLLFELFVATTF